MVRQAHHAMSLSKGTTAALTLSHEPWASSCCADLPGDWALYAVSVRRLINLHSRLPLLSVALAFARLPLRSSPSDPSSRKRPCLRLVFMLTNRRLINRVHIQGTCTTLVHAHAGRTQALPADRKKPRPLKSGVRR